MIKFVVGTKVKPQEDFDQRDFMAEAVLPIPTAQELANLPKSFSQGIYVGHTYYQNGWGSCTALGTTHSMLIQNIKEIQKQRPDLLDEIVASIKIGKNFIELDWESLWTKMGHDLNNKNDSGDYTENALNTAIKQGIDGIDQDGNKKIYFGQNFSFKASGRTETDKQIIKYYLTKYPIVEVIAGTNLTRSEMSKGEVKTVIEKSKTNGAHCICRVGYDEGGLRYLNSRSPNDQSKKKSVFYITRENYFQMVKVGMVNWRYWILFDKSEASLDVDFYKEESNAIETLKLVGGLWGKTRFPEIQKKCGELGAEIRKNYPRANKEVPLK